MNKKITLQFTVLTLAITLLTWGTAAVLGQFGITFDKHPWLWILFILGGLSPTYVSYIVLRKNGEVAGFKAWLKNVFHFKAKIRHYLLVLVFVILFFGIQIAVSGMTEMQPLYMFFLMLPVVFVGGGLEEAGWRYILQPQLDRAYGFTVSSVITGIIWWAWHIPLFFIPGTGQHDFIDFWMYAVNIIGMTFFYGVIIRVSGRAGVWLSVLTHTLMNAAFNTFGFYETWIGTITTFIVMLGASMILVLVHKKKQASCAA